MSKQLYEALITAKETIHALHGDCLWNLYQQSPEMQKINAAITEFETQQFEDELNEAYQGRIGECHECKKVESLTETIDVETGEPTGEKLCHDCCGNSGYCFGCGQFSAGTPAYEFSSMGHYCENCQEQIKAGCYIDEDDDDYFDEDDDEDFD